MPPPSLVAIASSEIHMNCCALDTPAKLGSRLAALAARHALPAIHYAREFVAAGGLIGETFV